MKKKFNIIIWYLLNNMAECKELNYSPCVYQEYKDIHKDECEIK
jgi:hypothetical protein